MINEPTVFILGAGASCPYGYPSGWELRQQIIGLFPHDFKVLIQKRGEIIESVDFEMMQQEIEPFVFKFNKSNTKSIDLFLARNPEFALLGKYAIIFRIFAAEKDSKFGDDLARKDQDWYSYLLEKMTDDLITKNDYAGFSKNKISLITFNYDRSLEHFLYESLINSFNGIDHRKIKEQLCQLKIIHVFDQVAGLDWQDLDSKIEYRCNIVRLNVPSLAHKLRIIYDTTENSAIGEVHKLITEARNIFFLGFGYAKENLKILGIPEVLKAGQRIFGTALHSTDKEILKVRASLLGKDQILEMIQIYSVDCLQLLRQCL